MGYLDHKLALEAAHRRWLVETCENVQKFISQWLKCGSTWGQSPWFVASNCREDDSLDGTINPENDIDSNRVYYNNNNKWRCQFASSSATMHGIIRTLRGAASEGT